MVNKVGVCLSGYLPGQCSEDFKSSDCQYLDSGSSWEELEAEEFGLYESEYVEMTPSVTFQSLPCKITSKSDG